MAKVTVILYWFLYSFVGFGQMSVSMDTLLMGSSFSFTVIVEEDLNKAHKIIDDGISEVIRIEKMISSWDKNSETSRINALAGKEAVKVPYELFALIRRSKKISMLSDGYFDISFGALNNLWDFSGDQLSPPSSDRIMERLALVNFRNIELNQNDTSVFLTKVGMKIGFGAIGKGYAANRAKMIMELNGAASGVVNAGGDLITWGKKSSTEDWSIGIQDPKHKENVIMSLSISNKSVVTSGNYERYFEFEGNRYCHIIDPKTGWPVKNLASVTIISPDAEMGDALATTVFVLGLERGMKLVNRLAEVEAIIVDEMNEIHFSTNIKSNYGEKK